MSAPSSSAERSETRRRRREVSRAPKETPSERRERLMADLDAAQAFIDDVLGAGSPAAALGSSGTADAPGASPV